MKIGFVTSYGSRCGIAEYSKELIKGLQEKGEDIKVCANFLPEVLEPDPDFVKRLFHCPFMTHKNVSEPMDMYEFLKDCDLVHIQFETSLYHPSWFPRFIRNFRDFSPNIKIVMTMHSSGLWPEFNPSLINHFISHEPMWCSGSHGSVIPMGVKLFNNLSEPETDLLCSFGLGRNDDSVVKEGIKGTNIRFETSYGNKKWLSKEELIKTVSKGWAICLMYPPVGASVSSSAAMFALGLDRPLIVSDTNWFNSIKGFPGVYFVKDIKELKETLKFVFTPENSCLIKNAITVRKDQIKQSPLFYDNFINEHTKVYKSLVKN